MQFCRFLNLVIRAEYTESVCNPWNVEGGNLRHGLRSKDLRLKGKISYLLSGRYLAYTSPPALTEDQSYSNLVYAVLGIWIWIHRIHMFLYLPDPNPLVRGPDPFPFS